MSTLKTTNLQHASAASPAIVLAADGSATAQVSSLNGGPLSGARNRIINGDMRIDQRNAGASRTVTDTTYVLDRYRPVTEGATSVYAVQQNRGSLTPPAGFSNYLGVATLSAQTVSGTNTYSISQLVEGFNWSDMAWGSASAQSATLSFWVRSSLTGTFGGSLQNSSETRSYPFVYSISAANTWEYKTITIAGDTSGTWLTDNGIGVRVNFGLGVGATRSGTANTWAGSDFRSATGAVSVVGTLNATWNITGVQLEAGTVATPFERIDYSESLRRCQRYYEVLRFAGWSRSGDNILLGSGSYAAVKRATPTVAISLSAGAGTSAVVLYTHTTFVAGNTTGSAGSSNCLFETTSSAEL